MDDFLDDIAGSEAGSPQFKEFLRIVKGMNAAGRLDAHIRTDIR